MLYRQVQIATVGGMVLEPKTARGRATRDRVVEAAATLVRQRGAAAVSLEDVEGCAGVGRSQLYHYFTDREDLIRAAAATTVEHVLARSGERLDALDTLAGIDRWFDDTIAATEQRGGAGGCPIGSLVSQLGEHDDQTRAILVQAFARWQAPLIAGLTRMRQRGELRAGTDVLGLADAIMAALQGGLLLAQVHRDALPLRRALAGARTMITAVLAEA